MEARDWSRNTRVTAPFKLHVSDVEAITYEAHILDFGGPRGAVVGVLGDKLGDCRTVQGFLCLIAAWILASSLKSSHQNHPQHYAPA